jgi:hypothetical protein
MSLCLTAFVSKAAADAAPQKKIQRAIGAPSQQWACPKDGTELRFRIGVGRRHATSHTLGQCFKVIKSKTNYKLWIDAVDAVIVAFFVESDLAPMVQQRSRLGADSDIPGKKTPTQSAIHVDAGTPVSIVRQAESIFVESDRPPNEVTMNSGLVQVQLPAGDIVASGWMPKKKLGLTSRKNKRRQPPHGKRIWIPGQVELLHAPAGERVADIASAEEFVMAVRLQQRDDHILIFYQGEYAAVTGWILATDATERRAPKSDAVVGLVRIEDTQHWVEALGGIYDRPNGTLIGVFSRDTEVDGRALKNGWVQLPLATELGTLNVWSPIYTKHMVH